MVLTGFIMHSVNPEYASGAYHTAEGLLMMGFGLSLLRAECWLLDLIVSLTGPAAPRVMAGAPRGVAGGRDRSGSGSGSVFLFSTNRL